MGQFYVIDHNRTLAQGVTVEGVTAAHIDKLLKKGRARIDVSPVHAMVKPVAIEISAPDSPEAPAIREKAGEVAAKAPKAAQVETSKENAAALEAAFRKDEAARAKGAKAKPEKGKADKKRSSKR